MTFGNLALTTYSNYTPIPIITNDWTNWNGSGDMPFSSLGDAYNTIGSSPLSTVSVSIDATRFLLISNGYTNPDTSVYVPATVTVGTLTGALPTYGTPVNLDNDSISDNGNVWYRGIKVNNGKIYINYSWYNGTQQFNYAKICNIANDGTITFGARSSNIGISSPSGSSVALDVTLGGNGHPYHIYYISSTDEIFIVATTINNDDSIIIATSKDMGQTITGILGIQIRCLNDSTLIFTNGNAIYAAPSTGTIIGNIAASLLLYTPDQISFSCTVLGKISESQIVVSYDNFTTASHVNAVLVSYNSFAFRLTKGPTIILAQSATEITVPLEVISIGNTEKQVLVNYLVTTGGAFIGNVYAICLTPAGTNLIPETAVQINANVYNNSSEAINESQSAVMSQSLIVSPFTSYDNVNFGLTILNLANAFSLPQLLYQLEASTGLSTTPFSPANGTGNLGDTTLTIVGDFTTTFVTGMKFYEGSNPAQSHIVTSSSYSAPNTTVNFSTPLYNNLVLTALTLLGIDSIVPANGFYDTITFNNSGERLYLGELNGQPTIISLNLSGGSTLASEFIAASSADFPSSVLATDFTLFIVSKISNGCIFDSTNDAILYPEMNLITDGSTMTTALFPTTSTPVEMDWGLPPGLCLITIIRQSGNSLAWLNTNTELASANNILFASGSALVNYLFNNFSASNPATGAISEVQLWEGALTDDQRTAISASLVAKYSL